jgi:heme o synthase
MAAAGASALNQYWERHSDGAMGRTEKRPLVNGDIQNPGWVPVVALLLIFVPSLAVLPTYPALTFFLLLGAFIYVGVYTIWLKPRTLLNIVIGGAAGSAAVLSGSAAAGFWNHPGALVLSLILFLWTPFHFWSLAIMYRDEYQRADVPMLPARTTPKQAAWWVMSHTLPTGLAGLLLAVTAGIGLVLFCVDGVDNGRSLLDQHSPHPNPGTAAGPPPLFDLERLFAGAAGGHLRGYDAAVLKRDA